MRIIGFFRKISPNFIIVSQTNNTFSGHLFPSEELHSLIPMDFARSSLLLYCSQTMQSTGMRALKDIIHQTLMVKLPWFFRYIVFQIL